jgi:hypothetical protein
VKNGWPQQPWICEERMAAATVDLMTKHGSRRGERMSRVNRGRGGYHTWDLIGLANQTAKDLHMRCLDDYMR